MAAIMAVVVIIILLIIPLLIVAMAAMATGRFFPARGIVTGWPRLQLGDAGQPEDGGIEPDRRTHRARPNRRS